MDEWKNYIGNANVDIFDVLKNAIKVAASDHPNEFRTMRDKIAEMLYSRELINYGGGDMLKKQSMHVSCEAEDEKMNEVLRIKAILDKDRHDECGSWVVCDLLRELQEMALSYEILEATGIGKSVNALKKHESIDVKETARMMINAWKRMVKERVDANENNVVVEEKEDECGESENNRVELQTIEKQDKKTSKPQRSVTVRIKLKKAQVNSAEDNTSKGPLTPEQKVADKSTGDESESVVCDSVKKLQHTGVSVKTDHATGIGKTLQKHASKDVSQQKSMDGWPKKESSSVKRVSMQVKPTSLDMERKINSGKAIIQKGPRVILGLQCKSRIISKVATHNQKAPRVTPNQQCKSQIISKVASNNQKGPRVSPDQQCKSRMNSKEATNNDNGPTNTSFQEKLEATKRKLQQHYMEEENLKKKRRVQVLELHEVIKKGRIPPKDQQVKNINKQFRR
ncbi:Transcription elongation factor, TFIIS/CRSP70 [Artemisia annua]|uniref:Transcription elongation factor, TFIIS/CRSP70 n=1 Tax=Artemisia annua TaxID=35608 RepID=A0A2U1M1F3_ARTAN|nr:Transcription elongation factor, TFIIS/CRSP70 [Artemisia annua]